MSAAIKRLVRLGYIDQSRDPDDARTWQLRLTARGARAMRGSSVLDATRVRAMLAALTGDERRRALEGLALLAKAANATFTRRKEQW